MKMAIMFQGTGSDVGKSVLVAGLARTFTNRGIRTLPFKPQNMSNNAAVTADGGEIGRAQALQAFACHAEPHTDMNPILLKPQSDTGSQIIVQGKVIGTATAADYQTRKAGFMSAVMESFERLSSRADLILVEGAGSPAETNLRHADIANMGFARARNTPVILIGDIDRGGVIASLVGTHAVLSTEDRALIRGFIINKFRGDVSLFERGLQDITQHTGWRSLGVLPWLSATSRLPAEDAVSLSRKKKPGEGHLRIAIPMLSRIANFDDFDALAARPDTEVSFVPPGTPLPRNADLIILPGTKSTIADMRFVRTQGWDIDILSHYRHGGHILGICGGYQMLGRRISDPRGIDGNDAEIEGLGLLDVETVMQPEKHLGLVQGTDINGHSFTGYEIHNGITSGISTAHPMLMIEGATHGASSPDGRVMGCYIHGLFNEATFSSAFIERLSNRPAAAHDHMANISAALDEIAIEMERHLDLDAILRIAQPGSSI